MSTIQLDQAHALIPSLTALIDEIQPDSIVSRTFYKGDRVRAMLFGFDTEQELSEHTSSHTAILQILQGEATVTLGDETHEAGPGFWAYMPPGLKHSVRAKTPVLMLLEMINCRE